MKSRAYLNILTASPLTASSYGRKLLEIWNVELPSLVPEKFGNYEPLRKDYVSDDLEAVLEFWDWPFLVKKRLPRMGGGVYMGGGKIPTHGWIHIIADYREGLQVELRNFLRAVASAFVVDFAFLHLHTRSEFSGNKFSSGVFTFSSNYEESLSVTTHELRKNIPDLYWLTYLGRPYSELFGRDKLLSTPNCAIVEELPEEVFSIQLSEEISDLQSNFEAIDSCRRLVKKHLDSNAFYDPKLGPSHRYSTPRFSFR